MAEAERANESSRAEADFQDTEEKTEEVGKETGAIEASTRYVPPEPPPRAHDPVGPEDHAGDVVGRIPGSESAAFWGPVASERAGVARGAGISRKYRLGPVEAPGGPGRHCPSRTAPRGSTCSEAAFRGDSTSTGIVEAGKGARGEVRNQSRSGAAGGDERRRRQGLGATDEDGAPDGGSETDTDVSGIRPLPPHRDPARLDALGNGGG